MRKNNKNLIWCKKQSKGIKLIEPNNNLFLDYINSAEETLQVLKTINNKSKIWLATTKYYCEYFAVYALLLKIGIKCEIHDCTIEVCRFLEGENILPKYYSRTLEEDKKLRIDNQYYLKNKKVIIDYNELLEFILNIKDIALKLTEERTHNLKACLKRYF